MINSYIKRNRWILLFIWEHTYYFGVVCFFCLRCVLGYLLKRGLMRSGKEISQSGNNNNDNNNKTRLDYKFSFPIALIGVKNNLWTWWIKDEAISQTAAHALTRTHTIVYIYRTFLFVVVTHFECENRLCLFIGN